MTNPLQVNEPMAELTGRTVEAFSLWADANQKVLRELVDLSAGTAKEGVRLCAEIQSSALEAVKEGQAYLLRRQDVMQGAPRERWRRHGAATGQRGERASGCCRRAGSPACVPAGGAERRPGMLVT